MKTVRTRLSAAVAGTAALGLALTTVGPATAQADATVRAETILPPGNSQTYTADGEARYQLTGDPDQHGPWIDDQREMYWDYQMKDGSFVASPDDCGGREGLTARDREPGLEAPREGVTVCWDAHGVPAVFGETAGDVWWGSGWVGAKLRLFLLEAAWRQGIGRLAELAGEGSLAQDIERRTTRYSLEEYQELYDALPADAKEAVDEYVAGVNAYVDWVTTEGRDQLPVEFTVLSQDPVHMPREGVLALGVEMVRFVAAEGRAETGVATTLKQLEAAYGRDEGRRIFQDFFWVEDERAATTVLREEGVFPRTDATAQQREAAFHAMADRVSQWPVEELFHGQGVDPTDRVALTDPELDREGGDDTGDRVFITDPTAEPRGGGPTIDPAAAATAALRAFSTAVEGGSWMVMIAPSRTADGSTLLVNEPQLDYDANNFLMELQLTGGGINARGSTVAGIPVVGIGYTPTAAWALTTGNSKTIDTFVETTREGEGGVPEYLHDGRWKPMDCRIEAVDYRPTGGESPVPVGPLTMTEEVEVCRTVHGPVVSWSEDRSHAAAWRYHLWKREIDTIEGVLILNRARTLDDIERGVRKMTWNENIGGADARGNIGYWHPGIHLRRHPGTDLRLPIPGTGEFDHGPPLPFEALPQVVNPERGWIVNWNNKPAHGWLDGGGEGSTSLPAGPDARVATLADLVGARSDWTFDALLELDREVSQRDFRARQFLDLVLTLRGSEGLTRAEQAALDLLAQWDRNSLDDLQWPGFAETTSDDPATVGAAPTIFDELVEQLDKDLFTDVVLDAPTLVAQQYMGRHIADTDTHLHLAMRVLDPGSSSLRPRHDYTRGRTTRRILHDVLTAAVDQLSSVQGDDPTAWRSVSFDDGRGERTGKDGEVCTAAGAVGPCGRHYFIERGAWVHHVGFPATEAAPPPVPTPDPPSLPATGAGAAVASVLLLGLALVARPRRSTTSAG